MPNYSQGKVYKLVSKDCSHDLVYIGSTCADLKKRLGDHISKWRIFKKTNLKQCHTTSSELFDKGEVDIILLERVNAKTREELEARERFYILNEIDKCVNKIIPGIYLNPNVSRGSTPIEEGEEEEDADIRKFIEDQKRFERIMKRKRI
jgi:hypothetical protein